MMMKNLKQGKCWHVLTQINWKQKQHSIISWNWTPVLHHPARAIILSFMMKPPRTHLLHLLHLIVLLTGGFFFTPLKIPWNVSPAFAAVNAGILQGRVKQTNKQIRGTSHTKVVEHKNKMWKIKTRTSHSESGNDYHHGDNTGLSLSITHHVWRRQHR